ncbi:hypothetical protein ACKVV1_011496 [Pyricularia oryzae]
MSITIEFEDLGQDFLVWTLNENGVVIECKPFQAWLWKGRQVVDYASLKRGDVKKDMDDFGNSINNYAFLMHDMIWKRIYFFTSAISGGSHVDAADNVI